MLQLDLKTKDDSAYAVISVCGDVAVRSASMEESVAVPEDMGLTLEEDDTERSETWAL